MLRWPMTFSRSSNRRLEEVLFAWSWISPRLLIRSVGTSSLEPSISSIFLLKWISLMRELVYSSKGSVLVNKSLCDFFSSACGLRPGCPLFLYLFILAEDILSLRVESLRKEGAITLISPVLSTPCLLLSVNDILLFLKAKKTDLSKLLVVIRSYQASSG